MDPLLEQQHVEHLERVSNAPTARELVTELTAAVLLVVVTLVLVALQPPSTPDWALAGVLIVVYAVFWQVGFEIGPISATPCQVAIVPMWFVVDPSLLPAVAAAGALLGNVISSSRDHEQHNWKRVFIAIPDAWYAVGPAVVLAAFSVTDPTLDRWPVFVLALAAQFLVDATTTSVRSLGAVGYAVTMRQTQWYWMVDAALAPIGLIVAVAMVISPWAFVTVVPLVGLLAQFAKERDARILKALELSSAYRGTAQLMGDVLEADDAYTGGEHTHGVVELSLAIGRSLALTPAQMRDLEFGALLHDIGKLRVPNEIINKPGKLTDEEWAIIKLHPAWGQEMLDRVGGALSDAGAIVRAHHERWDGRGYPDGLKALEIPQEARIITVCDSFSAMTTDRSYRRGMSRADAVEELDRCSGSQFDPAVVDSLKKVLEGFPAPHFGLRHPEPTPLAAPAKPDSAAQAA